MGTTNIMEKRLPNKEFRQLVSFLNKTKGTKDKIYEDKEPREINWPAYTLSQIKEAKETLTFIKKSVDKCSYPPRKVGRPLTDPKVLAKAVLVCEALDLTERKGQGWLEILGPFLGIYEELDDRVIGDAYDKPEVAYILKQVFESTKDSDGKLSGDGTGLETSRRQNYGENRHSTKEFITSILDSREIVQAFDFSGEDECKAMHSLIEQVEGDSLRLDSGFNDRELVSKIEELGMLPYVYPKKNNKLNGRLAWKAMYIEFMVDVIAWLEEYHQRSHAESFHSSFKRVFGILRKVRDHCKFIQLTARIILHNFRRLSYFKRAKD